jgi:hypothetical protein
MFSFDKKIMKKCTFFFWLFIGINFVVTGQQKEFSWLIGTWKLKDKNVFESWSKADDGKSLTGISYRIKGSDTVVMEQIRFTYEANSFHYIPDVEGDQGPVDFKVTQHTATGFVAENSQHDFPKLIRYRFVRKQNADAIEATIEGDGKVIPYAFERVR